MIKSKLGTVKNIGKHCYGQAATVLQNRGLSSVVLCGFSNRIISGFQYYSSVLLTLLNTNVGWKDYVCYVLVCLLKALHLIHLANQLTTFNALKVPSERGVIAKNGLQQDVVVPVVLQDSM